MSYSKNKSKKNSTKSGGNNDNEVIGIALILVSSLLLLCISLPILLGDVSLAIRNVVLGLAGFSSFAIFACTLLVGVAIVQKKSVVLSIKQILSLVTIIVAIIMILQIITTNDYMSSDVSTYISKVYDQKNSAGGLLFGIMAYGLCRAITIPITYIVLSLVIVGMILFVSKVKIKTKLAKSSSFAKGGVPSLVTPLRDKSLFVGTIEKPIQNYSTISGTFDEIDMERERENNFRLPIDLSAEKKNRNVSEIESSRSEKSKKPTAHKILFDDSFDIYKDYTEKTGNVVPNYNDTVVMPTSANISPDIKLTQVKKPPKVVHANPLLSEIILPKPKDLSKEYVGGVIINGDAVTEEYKARTIAESEKEIVNTMDSPIVSDMNARSIPAIEKNVSPIEYNPYPIMNGEQYSQVTTPQKQDFDKKFDSSDDFSSLLEQERKIKNSIHKSNADYNVLPKFVEPQPPISTSNFVQPPIINHESAFSEKRESFSKKEIIEEKVAPSFIFNDEVEDLSEYGFDDRNDHSGYYEKKPTEFAEKINAIDNQLRFKNINNNSENLKLNNVDQARISNYVQPKEVKAPVKHLRYTPPPLDLLSNLSTNADDYGGDYEEKSRILESTLESLKLPARVTAVIRGPAVTRYELEIPPGIPVKKIEQFSQDIAYNLACKGSIRIETPIPGKRAVGIEVPNEIIAIVGLKDIIGSKEFTSPSSPLTLALGKDIAGMNIVCNLEKMPHLLIAGATNSGKSACLNSIITSIIYKASPDDVRLILIDPKRVEFTIYKNLPHLMIKSIITEPDQAINAFNWAIVEMEKRYKIFSELTCRNIGEYNQSSYVKSGEYSKLPFVVMIVDELADLMMSANKKDVEDKIRNIAQKARAAGIHLILATQRPSVDVITGTIKANLPSRIAFAVTSMPDSRTILDQAGAEALLGRGDMLFAPIDASDPKRVQGAYVTNEEVSSIVSFVKENNEVDYDESVEGMIMHKKEEASQNVDENDDDVFDPLLIDVVRRVIESGQASTSMIQRRFSVGYSRASRIIDQMEMRKFIGPLDGSKPREVYISREQFKEIFGETV